jgi:hypothetical protein
MPAPYEIIAAPFTLYAAALGATFPEIATTPNPATWTKVGTSGDLSYADDGVTIEHRRTFKPFRALGNGGPRKIFIDEEDLLVTIMLADMTLEHFKHAMNQNTVTTVAAALGTAGYKKIGLTHGVTIQHRALLIRGVASGYGDNWNAQYEIPIASFTGSPKPVWRRADPVAYEVQFSALVDFSASTEAERFGRLLMQHEDAGT